MEFAFVTLLEKGALKRLQLVDQWPPEALAEYARLRTHVKPEDVPKPQPQPQPQARLVGSEPVVPVETSVETCAREFRELPSATWQAKWLRDQRNRPIAEQAAAEGKI